ncbi:MAG: glutathione S-transferase family protein [Tahibacter sp.]
MLTLFDYLPSQNGWKIRQLLQHLRRPYETRLISIFEGEGKTDAYRCINPTGAVPAVVFDDGRALAESNAILFHLAENTAYLPDDAFGRAKVLQWLSFEQNYVEMQIGTLRYWTLTGKLAQRAPAMIQARREASLRALRVLDAELAKQPFITGDAYGIADISLYAYASRADEAELDLQIYPHFNQWMNRVQAQDGHLALMYPYSIDPHASRELG